MPPQPDRPRRRVVLLGWDAADWKIISPLLDEGKMPFLRSIVQNGVMGNVASMKPMMSPMLWNSIATGKTADEHGILGFVEPNPLTGGVRPSTSTSRKVKALWNILNQEGLHSHVVSWFASHPAEPIAGVSVSEMFQRSSAPPGQPWPVTAHSVHPPELQDTLAEFRVHPGDLTGDDLLPFIPGLANIDQKKDGRPYLLACHLASTLTVHAVTTWILEHQPWDFVAAYFDLIDHAGHHFMMYHPPKMADVSEEDFDLYREVMTAVYRYQDLLLGRIIKLAGPGATIVIVSDHGFHSDELRPSPRLRLGPETPVLWHRTHGIFCMAGPGLRRDELVHGARLLDVAPTVLALFGLPAGQDMSGRVLKEAFLDQPPDRRIPSWEDVPGDDGMHPREAVPEDDADAAAALQQLADLGYIEQPDQNLERQLKSTRIHQQLNLARVYLSTGRPGDAIGCIRKIIDEAPRLRFAQLFLAQALFQAGRIAECRELVEKLLPAEQQGPLVDFFRANLLLAEGDTERALAKLLELEPRTRALPRVSIKIGRLYLRLRRWEDAERAFRSALEADPNLALAHNGLANALNGRGRFQQAAEAALEAVGLHYEAPSAHFNLGVALASTGRYPRAIQAFETCLSLRPNTPLAHEWLAAIHDRALADPIQAGQHRDRARNLSDAPGKVSEIP